MDSANHQVATAAIDSGLFAALGFGALAGGDPSMVLIGLAACLGALARLAEALPPIIRSMRKDGEQ